MVLPLLGLAGLAIGSAVAPHYANYAEGTMERGRARRQGRALEGLDLNDPNAVAQGLFQAGMLRPDQFQSDLRTGFENAAQRAQSDLNNRRSVGASYASIAERARQFNLGRLDAENQAAADQAFSDWAIQTYGTPEQKEMLLNPFATAASKAAARDAILARTGMTRTEVAEDELRGAQARSGIDLVTLEEIARATELQNTINTSDPDFIQRNLRNEYLNELQPIEALETTLDNADMAINNLMNVTSRNTVDAINDRNVIREAMNILQSDFFRNRMNRTDAPGQTEMEAIEKMFAQPDGILTNRDLRIIQDTIARARSSIGNQVLQMNDRYQRQGLKFLGGNGDGDG